MCEAADSAEKTIENYSLRYQTGKKTGVYYRQLSLSSTGLAKIDLYSHIATVRMFLPVLRNAVAAGRQPRQSLGSLCVVYVGKAWLPMGIMGLLFGGWHFQVGPSKPVQSA